MPKLIVFAAASAGLIYLSGIQQVTSAVDK